MRELSFEQLAAVNGGTEEEAMEFARKMGKKYGVRKLIQVLALMTDEELAYYNKLSGIE